MMLMMLATLASIISIIRDPFLLFQDSRLSMLAGPGLTGCWNHGCYHKSCPWKSCKEVVISGVIGSRINDGFMPGTSV